MSDGDALPGWLAEVILERLPDSTAEASTIVLPALQSDLSSQTLLQLARHGWLTGGDGLPALQRVFARLDPVWGGALDEEPENLREPLRSAKSTLTQGLLLECCAHAFTRQPERRFEYVLRRTDEWLHDWQIHAASVAEGVALAPPKFTERFPAARYWQMTREHERRQFGLPEPIGNASAALLARLAYSYAVAIGVFNDSGDRVSCRRLQELSAASAETAGDAVGSAVSLGWRLRISSRLAQTMNRAQPADVGFSTSAEQLQVLGDALPALGAVGTVREDRLALIEVLLGLLNDATFVDLERARTVAAARSRLLQRLTHWLPPVGSPEHDQRLVALALEQALGQEALAA